MSVFSVVGNIFKGIFEILNVLGPLLEVLKRLVPSLQGTVESIEDAVDRGEEVADDIVDRNRAELAQVRDYLQRIRVGVGGLEMSIDALLGAADDDAITAAELREVTDLIVSAMRQLILAGEESEEALQIVEKLKNA